MAKQKRKLDCWQAGWYFSDEAKKERNTTPIELRFDKAFNKYHILFADGSHGWYSQRAVDNLFPDINWEAVKNGGE